MTNIVIWITRNPPFVAAGFRPEAASDLSFSWFQASMIHFQKAGINQCPQMAEAVWKHTMN